MVQTIAENQYGNCVVLKELYRNNHYLCEINGVVVDIKKTLLSDMELAFVCCVLDELKLIGYEVEEVVRTVSGEPYIMVGEYKYIATTHIDGNVCDDIVASMNELASMHIAMQKIDVSDWENNVTNNEYVKKINQYKQIKKQLQKQNKKTDYDIEFIKNYEKYMLLCEKSLEYLNGFEIKENVYYNNVRLDNIIISDKINYVDYTKVNVGIQYKDVATLLYKYIKKCVEENIEIVNINNIMDKYIVNTNMTLVDINALRGVLHYPDRNIKVNLEYYGKNMKFTPSMVNAKMQSMGKVDDVYTEFVKQL